MLQVPVQKILFLLSRIDVFDGIRCVGSILCSYLSIFSIADIHESLKNKKDMDKVIYIGNLLHDGFQTGVRQKH